jgi:hypothetical protein
MSKPSNIHHFNENTTSSLSLKKNTASVQTQTHDTDTLKNRKAWTVVNY